jgi:hypothetical protein
MLKNRISFNEVYPFETSSIKTIDETSQAVVDEQIKDVTNESNKNVKTESTLDKKSFFMIIGGFIALIIIFSSSELKFG